jgi:hypothetical protein
LEFHLQLFNIECLGQELGIDIKKTVDAMKDAYSHIEEARGFLEQAKEVRPADINQEFAMFMESMIEEQIDERERHLLGKMNDIAKMLEELKG